MNCRDKIRCVFDAPNKLLVEKLQNDFEILEFLNGEPEGKKQTNVFCLEDFFLRQISRHPSREENAYM